MNRLKSLWGAAMVVACWGGSVLILPVARGDAPPAAAATDANAPGPRRIATPLSDLSPVAQVGGQEILGGAFRKRWLAELQGDPYGDVGSYKPVDANAVLLKMIGEIVLAQEARRKKFLETDYQIANPAARYRQGQLVNAAFQAFVAPKITASETEIQAALAKNPKLTSDQAALVVKRGKSLAAFNAYAEGLVKTLNVRKHTENYARAAEIHERLLRRPGQARKQSWILNRQIQEELSDEEKAIPLATFTGGRFTVGDLFKALGAMAPPGRPKNLGTVPGIAAFVDRSLRQPLAVAAAVAAGLDRKPEIVRAVRQYEDRLLYGRMLQRFTEATPDPSKEEIDAYYAGIKDHFQRQDSLTGDLIWCRNRGEARTVARRLGEGADVNDLQREFGLPKTSDDGPVTLYANAEGPYWATLWASEPNEVVGPLLGFYMGGADHRTVLRWRVVRVRTKTQGTPGALDDNARSTLKWRIKGEARDRALAEEVRRLLRQTPHRIYTERLSLFDPQRVP